METELDYDKMKEYEIKINRLLKDYERNIISEENLRYHTRQQMRILGITLEESKFIQLQLKERAKTLQNLLENMEK